MPADLSIIIVNYRTYELTRQTIESVINQDIDFNYDIHVVDNASNDGSLQKLQEDFKDNGFVKFTENQQNSGFANANNLAIKQTSSQYVLLLNSDTQLKGDCLSLCYGYIQENPQIGALGCKILLPDGTLDKACKRSFPDVNVSFYRMIGLSFLFPRSKRFGRYNLMYLDENKIHEVDSLSGAFMMVRRDAIREIGILDEDFFMYGEDIDWCYRFKEAGWKVIYYGKAEITHFKGGSGRESKVLYEFYNAMRLFYDKHYREKNPLIITYIIYAGIWGTYSLKKVINLIRR